MRTMQKLRIFLLSGVILLTACNDDGLKVLTWEHPDVKDDKDKVIFVIGNMGDNPIKSVRICMQAKHQYSHHGIPTEYTHIATGEIVVIEQPNWFDERRLCTYSRHQGSNFVSIYEHAEIVYPQRDGAGIYYLGAIADLDQRSRPIEQHYQREILPMFHADLLTLKKRYPAHQAVNFSFEQLTTGEKAE